MHLPAVTPGSPKSPIAKRRLFKPSSCLDATKDSAKCGDDVETLQRRFVGEVDLPERAFITLLSLSGNECSQVVFIDLEPLLIESTQRFVLFPIKYNEVRLPPPHYLPPSHNALVDMADVQASTSLLLDSGGNRSFS